MVNVVHDVSGELRDPHGKWTAGSGGIRAAARAAAKSAGGGGKSHEEILGHVRNLPRGSGRRINGHHIDRTQGDKYRVGFRKESGGRDTKLYGSPEDAAKAIHTGKHHEGGGAAATAGGARQGAQKATSPKPEGNGAPGRYAIVLTGKPNKDKTHYGVKDKQTGTTILSGVDQRTAMETAMDRNASVSPPGARTQGHSLQGPPPTGNPMAPSPSPAGLGTQSDAELKRARDKILYKPGHLSDEDHSRLRAIKAEISSRSASAPKGDEKPYAQTPDQQLRDMVARGGNEAAARELTGRIVAGQKARTEAENKARFPGGSTTINDKAGAGVGKPDLAGGATPPTEPGSIADIQRRLRQARELARESADPGQSQLQRKRARALEKQLQEAKAAEGATPPKTGQQNAYIKKAGARGTGNLDLMTIRGLSRSSLDQAYNNHQISAAQYASEIRRRGRSAQYANEIKRRGR